MDIETIAFRIALAIVALPIAYLIYKLTPDEAGRSGAQGRLGSLVRGKLSGSLLTYVGVTLLFVATFMPTILGLDLTSERGRWSFAISFPPEVSESLGHETLKGSLVLRNSQADAVRVVGRFGDQIPNNSIERVWDSEGYYDGENMLIPVKVPGLPTLMHGIGSRELGGGSVELPMFSLYEEYRAETPVYGVMRMNEEHPWINLIILALVPTLIVFVLIKVSPSIASVIHINWSSEAGTKIGAKIGGALAMFAVAFTICFLIIFEGLPGAFNSKDAIDAAERTYAPYRGEWYYRLYHDGGTDQEYAARMIIQGDVASGFDVVGRMTALWLAKPGEYDCYREAVPDLEEMRRRGATETEFRWHSDFVVLTRSAMIIQYRFFGTANQNPGLLYASLLPGEERAKWRYFDYADWRPESWFINSGNIDVFKPPTEPPIQECRTLMSAFD